MTTRQLDISAFSVQTPGHYPLGKRVIAQIALTSQRTAPDQNEQTQQKNLQQNRPEQFRQQATQMFQNLGGDLYATQSRLHLRKWFYLD